MAQVTYTGQLIYPTSESISLFAYNYTCAIVFNNDSGSSDINTLLDSFKAATETNFGGTLSYTVTTVGSETVVDVTWTGEEPTCFILSFGIDAASSVSYYVPFSLENTTPTILTDSCSECFSIEANECNSITFQLGLTEDVEYEVLITDKFNKTHSTTVTADSSGNIVITDESFTNQYLLNPYGGIYNVQVFLDGVLQSFVINNSIYNCFSLTIIAGNGLSNLVPNTQATVASDLDIEVLGNE